MGRPKIKEAKKQYTVMLKPSVVKEVDKLAKKLELTRSQLMASLVESGLDEAKFFNHIGLFKLILMGGEIARKLSIICLESLLHPGIGQGYSLLAKKAIGLQTA